jgi:hypothetical protein
MPEEEDVQITVPEALSEVGEVRIGSLNRVWVAILTVFVFAKERW